jgi:tripartite-type tricarboxylate transporter receptor subunit TctC
MNKNITRIARWKNALACFSLALALAPMAHAQPAPAKWPTGPVRFVVPFPAGSAPDVLIRFVGV